MKARPLTSSTPSLVGTTTNPPKSQIIKMNQAFATCIAYSAILCAGVIAGEYLGSQAYPDGKRRVLVKNGDIYERDWVKGRFVGPGMLIKPSGQILRGEWVDRAHITNKFSFSTNIAEHTKAVLSLPIMFGITGVYNDRRSFAAVTGEEFTNVLSYPNSESKIVHKESVHVHTVIVDKSAYSFAFTVTTGVHEPKKFNPF